MFMPKSMFNAKGDFNECRNKIIGSYVLNFSNDVNKHCISLKKCYNKLEGLYMEVAYAD